MNPLSNITLRTSVGLLFAILAILVSGTWLTVKITTDHLLYRNATETARNWAQFFGEQRERSGTDRRRRNAILGQYAVFPRHRSLR